MLNATNAGERDDKIAMTPLRRIGKPIEVAYGVLFLASDEASFVTGTELVIDGGFIAQVMRLGSRKTMLPQPAESRFSWSPAHSESAGYPRGGLI
jgi:Enoyl-(Acyl carrier protein) reductase